MTYDILRYIFIGAAILSGVMFVVSVLVFIFMNIPKVIGDLSGATARKAIKNIREHNEASGDKGYKVSAFNEARGKLTDKISPSGNVVQQQQAQMWSVDTTKISTQELVGPAGETSVLNEEIHDTSVLGQPVSETSVLTPMNETSVLGQPMAAGETSVLAQPVAAGETSVLSQPIAVGETAALSQPVPMGETAALQAETQMLEQQPAAFFAVEYEITYIHSNEIISVEAMG